MIIRLHNYLRKKRKNKVLSSIENKWIDWWAWYPVHVEGNTIIVICDHVQWHAIYTPWYIGGYFRYEYRLPPVSSPPEKKVKEIVQSLVD